MSKRTYATQLLKIVKASKKAISYQDAAKNLKASNPQLQDTEKNTMGIKNILERLAENGVVSKTRAGNYK